jgi:phosphatidylglycerol:prolipoprotein diacylglycerol transferase
MYPELFELGNIQINSWGVLHLIAFIICYFYIRQDTIRHNGDLAFVQKLFGVVVIGALIGAKLLPVLSNFSAFIKHPIRLILTSAMGRFHSVLLGGVIAGSIFALVKRKPIKYYLDLAVPAILLAQVIGRFGCFLNGCCFGTLANIFPGIRFPAGSPAFNYHLNQGLIDASSLESLPVHPVQFYEILLNLILFFAFVRWIRPKTKYQGTTFGLYLIAIGIERFVLEFVRINPEHLWGMTTFQLISLGMILLGSLLTITFIRQRKLSAFRNNKNDPAHESAESE